MGFSPFSVFKDLMVRLWKVRYSNGPNSGLDNCFPCLLCRISYFLLSLLCCCSVLLKPDAVFHVSNSYFAFYFWGWVLKHFGAFRVTGNKGKGINHLYLKFFLKPTMFLFLLLYVSTENLFACMYVGLLGIDTAFVFLSVHKKTRMDSYHTKLPAYSHSLSS